MVSLKQGNQVEAVVSEPSFEIITTLAYSVNLPLNPQASSQSCCYLLQHGVDRLKAAALDLSWTAVVNYLSEGNRTASLEQEIADYMLSVHGDDSKDPSRRFIVRLALKKDAKLSILSGPRPTSPNELYYPLQLSPSPLTTPSIPVYLDLEITTSSVFTKHKTTYRQPYSAAWNRVGLDETVSPATCDVLLYNSNGHIMGSVFRTVYFWRNGAFVTPSSETGCKMGVSRRWAVENAGVKETFISAGEVKEGEMIWLSSAVGGFIQGTVTLKGRI
ncbi:aminodeoxychorismate lyase [Colletotrichum truncatum]|uniref:Aminodeoxychorismate lyase n=1 Tax=Colletotrichum truncatum TaxID=5467 RepID=A0ACC3ZD30_COLTU|nr:aminodeoxychorismate lyase [Colletotrichum truncatum]KAF6797934.1 aminodeoxychorismate lyase [Colletotrichum truncatum]